MPKLVKEISSGTQFSRSSNEGQLADSQNRAYRIILDNPNETIDIQRECQVRIGDQHPYNTNLYCVSFDARFEGDSRMVIAVTFNYQTTAGSGGGGGADPKSVAPDVRPANWSISSSLVEIPLFNFFGERVGPQAWANPGAAKNPANDIYDGVIGLDAMVTISVQQFEPNDPTKHARHVGAINKETINLGSLGMTPHTVMFRGLTSQPTVESWGGSLYKGWNCTYEFGYKSNTTSIWIGTDSGGGRQDVELGWDVAIPQTGFNVKCFNPPGNARQDPFGQPLQFDDDWQIADGPLLSEDLAPGKKARAMVRVPIKKKSSQAPSASPIALNDDGTPRNPDLFPIVRGYQVLRDINLTQTLGLRLL